MTNLKFLLLFFLAISIIAETTIFSFPFVVIFSLFLFVLFPQFSIMAFIFISGIILDSLKSETVGATSLFLFLVFVILSIYQRVFNLKDLYVLLFFVLISSIIYANLFNYGINIFIYMAFFGIIFFIVKYIGKNTP